jgi:hypothetical protein
LVISTTDRVALERVELLCLFGGVAVYDGESGTGSRWGLGKLYLVAPCIARDLVGKIRIPLPIDVYGFVEKTVPSK